MHKKLAIVLTMVAMVLTTQMVGSPAYAGPEPAEAAVPDNPVVVQEGPSTGPPSATEPTDVGVMTHGIIHGCGVLWGPPHFGRPYCDLGRQGQQLAAAGSAAAIASAICLLGAALCPFASAAAAAAVTYVSQHGICSGNLRVAARPSSAWCA
jgi:hypothetical protein